MSATVQLIEYRAVLSQRDHRYHILGHDKPHIRFLTTGYICAMEYSYPGVQMPTARQAFDEWMKHNAMFNNEAWHRWRTAHSHKLNWKTGSRAWL